MRAWPYWNTSSELSMPNSAPSVTTPSRFEHESLHGVGYRRRVVERLPILDAGEDQRNRHVEDGADEERGDEFRRAGRAAVRALFAGRGNRIEANVGEEDDRPAVAHQKPLGMNGVQWPVSTKRPAAKTE
jgi:hypothetical protein